MKVIIEGCDGAGKTTVVEKLAQMYHCDIVRMTKDGSKKIKDYVDKHNLDNVVFDRCFLSEHIYCSLFGKDASFSKDDIAYLIKDARLKGYHIIILRCDSDVIIERLKKRGNEFDVVLKNIDAILQKYEEVAEEFDIPIIDSTSLPFNWLIDNIRNIVEEDE